MKGTKILTVQGYRLVETLNIGDVILTHERKPEKILDISRQIIKWNKNIPNELRIYRIPGRFQSFLTRNHKILVGEKQTFIEPWANYKKAEKRDICSKSGYYEIFGINIQNHESSHLLINYGKIAVSAPLF